MKDIEIRKIVILGSTGSIGKSTVSVLRENPGRFVVAGLAAGRASEELAAQIAGFRPGVVAVRDGEQAALLESMIKKDCPDISIVHGEEGLATIASLPEACMVLNALSGAAGIRPSLAALEAGKTLLTANKESLVAAGELIMEAAEKHSARILPVDSEHSAVFQCLQGEPASGIKKLIITASGGPFINGINNEKITPEMALRHPRWLMGPKITVDSATLMNKGLEVIEAMMLFNVPIERIQVLVHPECIVHSMVEFSDGLIKAQLSEPDMRGPIRYALNWPERVPVTAGNEGSLNLAEIGKLSFYELERSKFPCFELALSAAKEGGLLPAMMSAADEVAVAAFIDERIDFLRIPEIIESVINEGLKRNFNKESVTLESVVEADLEARRMARERVGDRDGD